jgi:signal transduction histidine kinase
MSLSLSSPAMSPISFYFKGNMPLIYFIYGLSFLILGFIALSGKERRSHFAFARILWLLSVFAITHGLHEWLEIFHLGYSAEAAEIHYLLAASNLALLIISYFFLYRFGIELIKQYCPSKLVSYIPWIFLCVVLSTIPYAVKQCESQGPLPGAAFLEILTRYLLGMPGSLCAAAGFLLLARDLAANGWEKISPNMVGGAIFFAVYGFTGGLVTPACTWGLSGVLDYDKFFNLTGVPVQLVRALSAFFITIFVGNSLTIFDHEMKQMEEEERREHALLEERNRIALELHDGVQQILFSIGIQAESQLMRTIDEELKEKLITVRDLAQRGIMEIRNTVLSLKNERKEAEWVLEDAVAAVAKEIFGGRSIPVEIKFIGKDRYPLEVENAIFRFFQEGLLNIHKHARASRVELGAHEKDGNLELWLWDNGVGLPEHVRDLSDLGQSGKIGLSGMRQRLEKLGGSLSFERPSAGGTLLKARIPLDPASEESRGTEGRSEAGSGKKADS